MSRFQFSTGPDPPQNFNKRRPNRAGRSTPTLCPKLWLVVVGSRLVAAAADWLACAALLRVSGDPDCLGSLHNASCTMHTFACLITWSFPELRLVDSITSTNLHGLSFGAIQMFNFGAQNLTIDLIEQECVSQKSGEASRSGGVLLTVLCSVALRSSLQRNRSEQPFISRLFFLIECQSQQL